jgi:hypothetical protein
MRRSGKQPASTAEGSILRLIRLTSVGSPGVRGGAGRDGTPPSVGPEGADIRAASLPRSSSASATCSASQIAIASRQAASASPTLVRAGKPVEASALRDPQTPLESLA